MITSAKQTYDLVHAAGFTLDKLKLHDVSEHFGWNEVFANRTVAQIKAAPFRIFNNAVIQSATMEKVRAELTKMLGREAFIDVSSWWRPADVNAAAGGAGKSPHLEALATDFTVRGYATIEGNRKIQAFIIKVLKKISCCLEITRGNWTHVDSRTIRIVFENLGGGRYRTLDAAGQAAFSRKYGGVS